ncbi:sigma-G-dependent sporulation-specific acid-soluble spore protein CsgA [Virgibacillus ndiopensis]|uniref:sigma-G-dependent sporulation-specific acid-soluble spore protein CsgA n=1 Tax=Virgibacillus ndiopensis TaxID=2004408 RepID=UPI000C06C3DA|nr:sigma-G-dependent sporulation-specific acid-soluble spore protein CsgA [Virgibacillus ndiopensis]
MDNTLEYLRESLSNYIESDICRQIYQKLERGNYKGEGEFVEDLNDDEMQYLNAMLEREINYAKNVQHDNRVKELNEVYELLF